MTKSIMGPGSSISVSPSPSSVSSSSSSSSSSWEKLKVAYIKRTPLKSKAIDVYLVCCLAMGLMQLAYCIATKGRNYQQFLAGFLSCVGSFVMAANVRLQMDLVTGECKPRAIAEFITGHVLLHLLVANMVNMLH